MEALQRLLDGVVGQLGVEELNQLLIGAQVGGELGGGSLGHVADMVGVGGSGVLEAHALPAVVGVLGHDQQRERAAELAALRDLAQPAGSVDGVCAAVELADAQHRRVPQLLDRGGEGEPEVLRDMLRSAPLVPRTLLPLIARRLYARRARSVHGTTRP